MNVKMKLWIVMAGPSKWFNTVPAAVLYGVMKGLPNTTACAVKVNATKVSNPIAERVNCLILGFLKMYSNSGRKTTISI